MSASAFILGAGFGTRLRPLTLTHPKPLMPILGRPLIDYALASLKQANIEHIMVNAHYLWEQVARWAEHNAVELQLELPDILGTGGGLKAALPRLNDKVIIWNGDILCDVSASKLLDACPENGAVMALRHSQNLGKRHRSYMITVWSPELETSARYQMPQKPSEAERAITLQEYMRWLDKHFTKFQMGSNVSSEPHTAHWCQTKRSTLICMMGTG